MSFRTRFAVIAGSAGVLAVAALAGTTAGASASVTHPNPQPTPTYTIPAPPHQQGPKCSALYGAYTGHQTNLNGWSLDTSDLGVLYGGTQITGVRHPRDCGQYWFSPLGDGNKSAVLLTSSGAPGNQVIGESHNRLVIVTGNANDKSQAWTAEPGAGNGFEWQNDATGDVITISSHGDVSVSHNTTPTNDNSFIFGA